MKRKIFLLSLILIITIINIMLFANSYYNKIEKNNNAQIKNESTNF